MFLHGATCTPPLPPSPHSFPLSRTCRPDALRALEVLEDCRRRSAAVGDKALTETLNKAIVALRSKLFVALLGKLARKR